MTIMLFIASALMPVSAAAAARPRMSYQEAVVVAEAQSHDPAVVKWAQEILAPLFETEYKALLENCMKSVSAIEPTAARIVVILDRDRVAITVDPEGSELFSTCVADRLQRWNWPMPPKGAVYVPLELNARPPDPAEADKAAEQIIRDIAPTNKSLERAREE
jgi:hypothetical protein